MMFPRAGTWRILIAAVGAAALLSAGSPAQPVKGGVEVHADLIELDLKQETYVARGSARLLRTGPEPARLSAPRMTFRFAGSKVTDLTADGPATFDATMNGSPKRRVTGQCARRAQYDAVGSVLTLRGAATCAVEAAPKSEQAEQPTIRGETIRAHLNTLAVHVDGGDRLAELDVALPQARKGGSAEVRARSMELDLKRGVCVASGNARLMRTAPNPATLTAPKVTLRFAGSTITALTTAGATTFEVTLGQPPTRRVIGKCTQRAEYDSAKSLIALRGNATATVETLPQNVGGLQPTVTGDVIVANLATGDVTVAPEA